MQNTAKKRLNIFYFILLLLLSVECEDVLHVLQPGETLYGLSRKYNLPLSAILERNKIKDSSKIKAGEKIIIPNTYTIKDGDTLYGISRKFGISVEDLMRLNSLTKTSIIKPGDVLIIPRKKDETPKKNSPEENSVKTPPAPAPDASKPAAPAAPFEDPRNYSLKQADPKLLWPVPASKVFYISGKILGVVITSEKSRPVQAITSGKVISAGTHRGFGKVVFIQSETKHIYVYGGMDKIAVKANEKISLNQKIGELGTDAFTGASRLYFMVYEKNKPIDPARAPRGF